MSVATLISRSKAAAPAGSRAGGAPVGERPQRVEHVVDAYGEQLAGRRAILSTVFERIEVHPATTRGYDPDRIKLVWRTPRVWELPVLSPPPTTPSPSVG